MVLLESIAHKRPAIASDVGGVSEIIRDGETGLLFEPGNPADLAEKAIRLLKDQGLCERMGDDMEGAAHRYSPEHHYSLIHAIYKSCADG